MNSKNLKHTCVVRRNRDIQTATEFGLEYKKAAATKKILREAFEERLAGTEIKKRTMKEFAEIDFPTKETGEIVAVDMARCINRYVKNEQRIPRFASTMNLDVCGSRLTLKPVSFESLMVVGDDSQAIFSFRDTTPEYIVNFFDILEESGEDFFLLENHRSTPEIIDLANKLNALNKEKVEKDLIATRPHGVKPIARGFFNKTDEEEYIVEEIRKKIEEGRRAEDIAFIASNKYELLEMGAALTEACIPWVMLNPEPVLENSKVVASIALAKAIQNPDNTEAMLTYDIPECVA